MNNKKIWRLLKVTAKITSIAYGLFKTIELVKRLKLPSPSYSEKLHEKLNYEKQLMKMKEEHLRNKLSIMEDFDRKKCESEKGGSVFRPMVPHKVTPGEDNTSWDDLRLFGSALHVGDKCCVIAPKGVGKTGLMMQVGNAIASGEKTGLWPLFEDGIRIPQRVLYYDGELTDFDMYNRYYKYDVQFHEKFERYDQTQFRSAHDILFDLEWKVENEINSGEYATAIFDNITKLLKTEQVSAVNSFLETLDKVYHKAAARGIKLTVISVIHVLTKEYIPGTPINLKVAAGGSNLTNFNNSIIAIEKPKGEGKTIAVKVLNSRGEPEPDNVCVLRRLGKDEGTHYHFEYVGDTQEKDYLKGESEDTKYEGPKRDGRGDRWTEEDTERLRELASTLETPDKEHIAPLMGRTANMINKMARVKGIKLKTKPRGRKPKENSEQ